MKCIIYPLCNLKSSPLFSEASPWADLYKFGMAPSIYDFYLKFAKNHMSRIRRPAQKTVNFAMNDGLKFSFSESVLKVRRR